MNTHTFIYNPNHSAELNEKYFHLSLNCKMCLGNALLCSLGHGTCAPSSQIPRIFSTTLWRLLHLKRLVIRTLQSLITRLRNQRSSLASKHHDGKHLAQNTCHYFPTIPNYTIQSSIASGLTAGAELLELYLEGKIPIPKNGNSIDTLHIATALGETRFNLVPVRSS